MAMGRVVAAKAAAGWVVWVGMAAGDWEGGGCKQRHMHMG